MIYLLFNEGYLSTAERAHSRDLVDDAEWLVSLLHQLMPTEPEVAGLLALIRLHRARAAARFDLDGRLVLLQQQDRSLWDREIDRRGQSAAGPRRPTTAPGPYQLQAAIVACHAEAQCWQDTDWEQIVLLYDMLLHLAPSPVIRLHRAIALRYRSGPQAAMTELDTLADELDRYHLYHATRADLHRELGRPDQARAADRRALELTANPAEQPSSNNASPAPTKRRKPMTMTDITQLHRALVARVLDRDGKAPPELRRAAFDNAGLSEPTRTLIEKVAYHANLVTDEDVAAVRAAGLSEDQIFETVVCAAVGQSNRRYNSALAAVARATGETGAGDEARNPRSGSPPAHEGLVRVDPVGFAPARGRRRQAGALPPRLLRRR